ncbi:chorismate mutase [Parasphingorhabdus sp. NYA22]
MKSGHIRLHLVHEVLKSKQVELGQRKMDEKLKQYRESINNIDAALVFMLAERFKVTQAVGEYKAENSLPPADGAREQEQIARLRQLASDANLDPEFSEKFLRFIIDEVIRHHERIKAEAD